MFFDLYIYSLCFWSLHCWIRETIKIAPSEANFNLMRNTIIPSIATIFFLFIYPFSLFLLANKEAFNLALQLILALAMREKIFSKTLKKTDTGKRLSVPSAKKKCFLNFRAGQYQVEFKAIDKYGKAWPFACSIRKEKKKKKNGEQHPYYPKPVLSKGWLKFVSCWKLGIGDEVILYLEHGEAGQAEGQYRIEVNKRATKQSCVESLPLQDDDSDITITEAIDNNVKEEPTISSKISNQSYDQIEGIHNQPITGKVALKFDFLSLAHYNHIQVIREPKLIDFFELASQDQGEKEQPSQNHMVESHIMNSMATNFIKFL